jgi:hypothetical protein
MLYVPGPEDPRNPLPPWPLRATATTRVAVTSTAIEGGGLASHEAADEVLWLIRRK